MRLEDEPASHLVARATRAEPSAEAELCRRFVPAVRAFARRRLRDPDAVEEFSQDVLLVLLEALREGRVAAPERLGGFVLGICRNLVIDRARQHERRKALWEVYGAALETVSVAAVEKETYEVIHLEDCLNQLSKRARDLIRLGYIESRPHEEIATELQISESNARVLRHRALSSLRDCMSKRLSWEVA